MKTLALLVLMSSIFISTDGQVVSNVNWELEGNDRIVITYDLAKLGDVIYFDVFLKVMIANELIPAKALSGDVGNYIKVGTNKKIVWNLFEDISALNGELSVEVLAVNPVPVDPKPSAEVSVAGTPAPVGALPKQKIPFWAGMGGIGVTGAALLTTGIKSASDGQELYKTYKENTVESSSIYTDIGSTRDEVYSEANKKYKNGTLLQVAGAAIFLTAGVMIVSRMIQAKKVERRSVAVAPQVSIGQPDIAGRPNMIAGLTMRYRLR